MELRMSSKERDRLKILDAVIAGRLKQVEAARLLNLCPRQVRRLLERYRAEGDAGLVHRLRGQASNRKLPGVLKRRTIQRVKKKYSGFGPTLAAEYLAEHDGITLSRETLRHWMIEEGLWKRRKRGVKHRQWRERRSCFGEMVQIDTSIHDWLEGRGEAMVLIAMIDDATSRIRLRFFAADSTASNMEMILGWLRAHGRPLAIYADRASHFTITRKRADHEAPDGPTQIERSLGELGIEYIAARSPQAKGRVERAFKTLQDRLVKAMRVVGLTTMEQANAWLQSEFVPLWNARFTVRAACGADAHRPLRGYDLASILSTQTLRRVNNDYTVSFKGQWLQIEKKSIVAGLRGSFVTVEERLGGLLRLKWGGRHLKHRRIVRPIKHAEEQDARPREGVGPVGLRPPPPPPSPKPRYVPPPDHPWRKGHF